MAHWASSFWSPSWWAPGWFPGDILAPVLVNDGTIYVDIQTRLKALVNDNGGSLFDDVLISDSPTDPRIAAGDGLTAIIMPLDWEEDEVAGDEDAVCMIRTVRYTLSIVARMRELSERIGRISGATSRVQNAIDGQCLAGETFPILTRMRRGKPETANFPSMEVNLEGTYTYMIRGYEDHDEVES